MDSVLQGMLSLFVHLDDILIASASAEEHRLQLLKLGISTLPWLQTSPMILIKGSRLQELDFFFFEY